MRAIQLVICIIETVIGQIRHIADGDLRYRCFLNDITIRSRLFGCSSSGITRKTKTDRRLTQQILHRRRINLRVRIVHGLKAVIHHDLRILGRHCTHNGCNRMAGGITAAHGNFCGTGLAHQFAFRYVVILRSSLFLIVEYTVQNGTHGLRRLSGNRFADFLPLGLVQYLACIIGITY